MQHSLYIRCVHWSPAVLVRRNMNDFCQQLRARYQIVEGDMSFAADNFAEVPQNLESSPSLQGDMANKVEALGLADSFEAPALGSDSIVAPALNGSHLANSLQAPALGGDMANSVEASGLADSLQALAIERVSMLLISTLSEPEEDSMSWTSWNNWMTITASLHSELAEDSSACHGSETDDNSEPAEESSGAPTETIQPPSDSSSESSWCQMEMP